MTGARVRPAVSADAEAISAVVAAAVRVSNAADYPPAVVERVAAGFAPHRVAALLAARLTLVAERDGAVVGTAALDGSAVRSVFVHPDAQRRGIGAALMAEVVRLAAERGTAELVLRSSMTAVGFYARLGFAPVRDHWHGEERTVEMRAPVRSALPPGGAPWDTRG